MDWITWYLNMAGTSMYFIAPLGFILWLVFRLFRFVFPNVRYLTVPFVLLGVVGFFAIETFPGYNYQLENQKKAAGYPHVKAHVLSYRISVYNPFTWIWEQPNGYLFVRPTEADYLMGRKDYKFGADENTFMVELSTFDGETKVKE